MLTGKLRSCVYCLLSLLAAGGNLLAYDQEEVKPGVGQRIDEFFTRFEALGFHGTVLVATGDGVVLHKGYGFADRQRGVRNAAGTVFGIASLDKQFTAAAILLLEQQDKLKTSDAISKYIEGVPEDKSAITIAHLLNHRSGLPNAYRDSYPNLAFNEFVDKVLSLKLAAEVGKQRIYTNVGYNLLEFIIEQVSEMDYETFLAKHLFQPAGMKQTGHHLVQFAEDKLAKYRTTRSQQQLLKLEPERPDAFLSLRTTVGDFYRWHLALQSDQVLSSDVKQKLFRPVDDNYANGWFIGRTSRDTPVHYHGGYDTAVQLFAMLYRYPAEDTVVAVFGNTIMNETLNRSYLSVIVERLIWGGTINLPPEAASVDAERLRAFEGNYVLENGGKFQILRGDAGIRVKAGDSKAILALTYPDSTGDRDSRDTHSLDPLIPAVFFGFEKEDYAPLETVLLKKASFEKTKETWARRWRRYRRSLGSLQSVRAMHRLETEYAGAPEVQTHLLLEFEQGTRLLRALADADGRYWFDLISLPRQVEMPLVPVSETELASWNLKLQMGPRLQLGESDGHTLTVLGKAGRWKATRETSD